MRWVEGTKRIGAPLLCAKQSMLQSSTSCLLRPATSSSPACPSCRLFSVSSSSHREARVVKDKDGNPLPSTPIGTRKHGKNRQQATLVSSSPSKTEPPTLFKKLFPNNSSGDQAETPMSSDESIGLKPIRNNRNDRDEPPWGHPTRLKSASDRGTLWEEKRKERVSTEALRAWLESQVEEEEKGATAGGLDKLPDMAKKTPVVLIMFNASKSLTESDFHRLVRQNPHLEGWNSQLEKVAQAYDRNTLEPFGCYFLHFNSATAARKFQLEAQQLHNQAPKDTLDPYSTPSLRLAASPETPLRLKMYTLQPHTIARLRNFTLEGVMSAPKTVVGGLGKKNSQKTKLPSEALPGPHKVVLSLQHGAVELTTLQDMLRQDGVSRNLAWDVTDILPYFPHKAVTSSRMMKSLAWKNRTAVKADGAPRTASEASESSEPTKAEASCKSGRFVLSFGGEAEARRFTRMWHRRELQLPKDANAEDDAISSITVNAMIPL